MARRGRNVDRQKVARHARQFSALGAEPRLRILRLLLAAHPAGMVAGEIQSELGIPASTLSHHLEKLRAEGLVKPRREGPFLWYSASTQELGDLVGFLYAECCTRNRAVEPEVILERKHS
jgi:ArsR family transcriptional regulator